MDSSAPIGIFDSGVGGISVLKTALELLPKERFVYYGDSAHAPYGTRPEEEVRVLARNVTDFLLNKGCKAIVIACNTATCAAAQTLRQENADLIIVGMEPALKLAHDTCPEGTIAVLATPLSLSSAKYRALYEKYGEHSVSVPCAGLMELVEKGETDSAEVTEYLSEKLGPFLTDGSLSAVVLGCTHYVFLKDAVKRVVGDRVRVLDGNEGTVRQLMRRLDEQGLLNDRVLADLPRCELNTSGSKKDLAVMEVLLEKH